MHVTKAASGLVSALAITDNDLEPIIARALMAREANVPAINTYGLDRAGFWFERTDLFVIIKHPASLRGAITADFLTDAFDVSSNTRYRQRVFEWKNLAQNIDR